MNTLAVMTAGMHSPLAGTVALEVERPASRRRRRRQFHLPSVRMPRLATPRCPASRRA